MGLTEHDKRHGTVTGYKDYGCRCAPCRAAYAAWQNANIVIHRATREGPTPEQLRIYGQSLGLPVGVRGPVPAWLVTRWNHTHPDQPYPPANAG